MDIYLDYGNITFMELQIQQKDYNIIILASFSDSIFKNPIQKTIHFFAICLSVAVTQDLYK